MRDANRCVVVNPVRRRLFKSSKLSDVELVIEGSKWPAHAFVLAEGSKYFERMWTSDLVEGQTKKVSIEGVDASVMEVVLRYLYGCLDTIPVELVVPVVQAADRYEVAGLKLECLNLMLEDLCLSNLVDYWQLGVMFGFEDLVNACVQLGAEDPFAILSTESFEALKATEPMLAVHMLQAMCAKLQNNFQETCLNWVGREETSGLDTGAKLWKNKSVDVQAWEQLLLDLSCGPEV